MNETADESERDSAGGIFGITLGLSLFAVAILVAVSSKAEALEDPAEVWAQYFEAESVPSGFEFSEAALLPGDRMVVKLRRSAASVPMEDTELARNSLPEGEGSSEPASEESLDSVDWSALKEGERSLDPDELVFVIYPSQDSGAMLETYFQDLSQDGVEELGLEGGTLIVESGEFDWLGFETHYVRQREFRVRGNVPGFRDSLRVNLSVGQSCVLIALWPVGAPSSVESLEELLAQVEPRSTQVQ